VPFVYIYITSFDKKKLPFGSLSGTVSVMMTRSVNKRTFILARDAKHVAVAVRPLFTRRTISLNGRVGDASLQFWLFHKKDVAVTTIYTTSKILTRNSGFHLKVDFSRVPMIVAVFPASIGIEKSLEVLKKAMAGTDPPFSLPKRSSR
jgi:hypothetical protein